MSYAPDGTKQANLSLQGESMRVGIIGLGYVGLPLAIACSTVHQCIGFDLSSRRITELKNNIDRNKETPSEELDDCTVLFSNDKQDLVGMDIYVVTVPTPISQFNEPDLSYLKNASELVGSVMKCGSVVIYESTVYPGATEEFCVPILESVSSMKLNQDFFVGYSPERINPAERSRHITSIVKVTSGSTPGSAEIVDSFYRSFITAGTFTAPSIRVAEASKVVENIQRDVNIALMNELATIFDELEISTKNVLDAAATKWNFLNFYPGLVGGHCISVDPYYLTRKAQQVGLHSDLILTSRRVNSNMPALIARKIVRKFMKSDIPGDFSVMVLGAAFKENCTDFRNSKSIDVIAELEKFDISVTLVDPLVDVDEFNKEYNIQVFHEIPKQKFSAIFIAIPHREFLDIGRSGLNKYLKSGGFVFDLRGALSVRDGDLVI